MFNKARKDTYSRGSMLKTIVIGLAIALIGIAVLSTYGQAVTYERVMAIATKGESGDNESWDISANLTAGDNMTFIYRDGWNWTAESAWDTPDDGSNDPTMWVFVQITPVSPPGNVTGFGLEARLTSISSGEGTIPRLTIFNITVEQEGSIDTSVIGQDNKGRYHYVGGRIPWNGTYAAHVGTWPSRAAPPSFLGFYRNITVTTYPNTNFLPVGGTIIVSGGALLAYGVRGTMNHNAHRRRKIEKRWLFHCRKTP
jgi:hypothetical protein